MDAATQEDLKTIREVILEELNDVEAIYLFGSVAKETQNEKSDYDILIFVKKYPADKLKIISRIRYNLLGKIKRPLEIFMLDVNDLNYPSPFLYEVYHNNKLLHGKNIIIRCREAISKMKPLVLNGVKVGYYV
ncbi:nucleotidyltransferase domain-containing protein [Methanocella sp. MCL-LM]|uniref:nucleotidyltransferase domain-containing protein n=1 Tax=Methanocella sp. MCL-LM TaxID=3412035 RepID=UPI003C74AFE7